MFMYRIRYKGTDKYWTSPGYGSNSTVWKRRADAALSWNYRYPNNKIADTPDVEIVKFKLIEVTDR